MTPWIIPVYWHFAISWLYPQVDLITCTVRNISGKLVSLPAILRKKKKKRKQTLALALSLLGWLSNRTATSVDHCARKSNNWLDQWLSGTLGTGSWVVPSVQPFFQFQKQLVWLELFTDPPSDPRPLPTSGAIRYVHYTTTWEISPIWLA